MDDGDVSGLTTCSTADKEGTKKATFSGVKAKICVTWIYEFEFLSITFKLLFRGGIKNYTTCDDACSYAKSISYITNRYFRCFNFEDGNFDDVTDKGKSGTDIDCTVEWVEVYWWVVLIIVIIILLIIIIIVVIIIIIVVVKGKSNKTGPDPEGGGGEGGEGGEKPAEAEAKPAEAGKK